MARRGKKERYRMRIEEFPIVERYTVSGHCIGDICFQCECRIVEIRGEEGMMFAWCACAFPEDHHEMEIL
jgi:hypothetical protein